MRKPCADELRPMRPPPSRYSFEARSPARAWPPPPLPRASAGPLSDRPFPSRPRAAFLPQAYHEWMPIRSRRLDGSYVGTHINRTFHFGSLASLFVTEERITGEGTPTFAVLPLWAPVLSHSGVPLLLPLPPQPARRT